MSENEEIYTAGKNFTLPPALTALTNSTSAHSIYICQILSISNFLAEDQYYLESIPDTIQGAPSYGRRT